jgi:hypothetical protein
MKNQELVELCKWDFLSYEAALAISPYGTNVIRYTKIQEPYLREAKPSTLPEFIPREHYEIRVGTEPFGFYSWMPSDNNARALVLEQKTKPKPWTDYKPKDEKYVDFISSTIEALVREHGFLAGVSCVGGQFFPEEFVIMFARSPLGQPPIYANFSVSEQEMFVCQNQQQKIEYLDFIAGLIIHEREDFCG